MALEVGADAVTALRAGTETVARAYAGSSLVFGAAPPTGDVSTGVLPFAMPTRQARAAITSHSVFAHYFNVFPMVQDHLPPEDAWDDLWLPPGGGAHAEYGGRVRSRKDYTDAVGPTAGTLSNAQAEANLALEVEQAIEAGLDGFAVEILTTWGSPAWNGDDSDTSSRAQQVRNLIDAAGDVGDPYFWLSPMLDGYASGTRSVAYATEYLQNFIRRCTNRGVPLWKRVEGGETLLMLPTFAPEGAPWSARNGRPADLGYTFWEELLGVMDPWVKANGHADSCALWGAYVFSPTSSAAALDPLAYGHGRWGEPWTNEQTESRQRDPAYFRATYSKPFLAYVKREVLRPKSGTFDYRDGFGSRSFGDHWDAWLAAREDATAVQVVTWDDFGEGTEIAPSVESGRAWCDLNAFYAMQYKTGATPTIVRDCIYLSNRKMLANGSNTYTGSQTRFMVAENRQKGLGLASDYFSDIIEARVFATADSTVEFRMDGALVQTTSVPAGVSSVAIPARLGLPTVRLVRGGGVVTEVEGVRIVNTLSSESLAYYLASSLRQTPAQADDTVQPDAMMFDSVLAPPSIGGSGGLLVEEVKAEVDETKPYTLTLPTLDVPDDSLMLIFAACSRLNNMASLTASGLTFTPLTPAYVQPSSSNAVLHAWQATVSNSDSGKVIDLTWSIADRKTAWVGLVVSGHHPTDALHKVAAGANNSAVGYTTPTLTTTEDGCVELQVFLSGRGDNPANDGFNAPAGFAVTQAHSTGDWQNVSIAVGTTGVLVGSGATMGGDLWQPTLAGTPQTNGNCAYVIALRQA